MSTIFLVRDRGQQRVACAETHTATAAGHNKQKTRSFRVLLSLSLCAFDSSTIHRTRHTQTFARARVPSQSFLVLGNVFITGYGATSESLFGLLLREKDFLKTLSASTIVFFCSLLL